MKYLFVAPERIIQQAYRHGTIFRVAAALLIAAALAQLPIIIFAFLIWQRGRSESDRAEAIAYRTATLQREDAPLRGFRLKLEQIRRWEPIFKDRLPVSALLSAIESSTPDDAVLDAISLESDQFEKVPVKNGIYRVPTNYRLVIQGLERSAGREGMEVFQERLQKRLPTGSELIRSEKMDKRPDDLVPFVLRYSIKPSGNYFGLGINRAREPDSL